VFVLHCWGFDVLVLLTQVVLMKLAIHFQGRAGIFRKHISKMEGMLMKGPTLIIQVDWGILNIIFVCAFSF
jgi:hypothetical protein